MKPQFIHSLSASFYLWFDHQLLYKAEAFKNTTGKLYYSKDPSYSQQVVFGSPFAQWVSDYSVTGATIPDTVIIEGLPSNRGMHNMKINFGQGKLIFDQSVFPTNSVSASYAVKDFNVYPTKDDEVKLLFETAYSLKPKTPQDLAALPDKTVIYPCIFLKYPDLNSEPFAFGGQDQYNYSVRAVVIADEHFKLDGVCGLFQDFARSSFPIIPTQDIPFNVFGDFKSGNYNYLNLISSNKDFCYIKNVSVSYMGERETNSVNNLAYMALIDFDIEKIRFAR